ncbi:MAG: DUF3466 family protein [Nitrosomonas sp.]|nr:MAG: DUF3466 family protein [Nitrosomonas sp.]
MNDQPAKLKKVAIFLAVIFTVPLPTMAHADWSIIGLGTLGEVNSQANDINDSGQVAGLISGTTMHAFITGLNGVGMVDLGTLGGVLSQAFGINNSGQVVGYSSITGYDGARAFITGPNGVGMTDLGTLGGRASYAYGINDSGQVVGGSSTASGLTHAFITGPNGIGMTDLGTLLGGTNSFAYDINDSGQVVGVASTTDPYGPRAFITGPNGIGMTDLGTLGGRASYAYGINDSGQVVGDSSVIDFDGAPRAFITGPNGINMTDLGTLGGRDSRAYDINDSGEVVGVAYTARGELHSFIFSHGGMTDLSLLTPVVAAGWTNLYALSINNNGQIAGYGHHQGHDEAFLLSYTSDTVFDPKPIYIPPVPEPETYLMLLGGLGLIGYMSRRRKEAAILIQT